ncbi:S24/S26 family peptidase [Curtobacterium sp. Csp2]|uniref:S24/S26 family peptidase n=1 Tax=Curtobacterium sp. Csp2 TaxID=2495430 RepID=UPI0015805056|nr:S24/S26 family peptidase [Curtobacterium sp. Csp2]QKS17476.1 S24/S26 family peptidase [Curtobacterium sp. Csp2]
MDTTGVGGQHRHARPDTVLDALDWGRVVVGTLARGIVATVLGLALWAAVPAVVGWQPTTVVTASMAPRLVPGDVVVSRPVPAPEVVPGRVLLADDPDQAGHLRLHRYVETGADGTIVTKGDANPAADSTPLDRSAVHGVGYLRVPFIGTPVLWAHEGRWGAVAAAAAALAGLLALCTVDAGLRRTGREARGTSAPHLPSDVPRVHGRRSARGPRRPRSVVGLIVVLGVIIGTGTFHPLRAEAVSWSTTTRTPTSSFTAASVRTATITSCTGGGSATIGWTWGGVAPPPGETVGVYVGDQLVVPVTPSSTSAVIQGAGLLKLGARYEVTVRTENGWTQRSNVQVLSVIRVGLPPLVEVDSFSCS